MEATGETSVYVVTDDGEILSLTEAAVLALRKAAGEPVEKASRTLRADALGGRWVEPRIQNDALLAFLDWNTWHRRCCVLKALMVAGLGWRVERDGEEVYDARTGEGDAEARVVLVAERKGEREAFVGEPADGLGDGLPEVLFTGVAVRRSDGQRHDVRRRQRRGLN